MDKPTKRIVNTLTGDLLATFSAEFRVWVGDHGYDTRPRAVLFNTEESPHKEYAPVACSFEYANNHTPASAHPAEDIEGWLRSLPEGTLIILPDYCGMHLVGEFFWEVMGGSIVPLFYEDLRAQAYVSPEGEYTFFEYVEEGEYGV